MRNVALMPMHSQECEEMDRDLRTALEVCLRGIWTERVGLAGYAVVLWDAVGDAEVAVGANRLSGINLDLVPEFVKLRVAQRIAEVQGGEK